MHVQRTYNVRSVIWTSQVEPMATKIILMMHRMKTTRGACLVNLEVLAHLGSPCQEKFW